MPGTGTASTTRSRRNGSNSSARWLRRRADHAELEIAIEDPVDHRPGRVHAQGHLDPRMRRPEPAQQLRQHVLAGPGRRADDQVAGRLVRVLRQLPRELVAQREHAKRVAVQHLTAVGRGGAAAGAVDSGVPSIRSSVWICWLTAGCVTPSASAAAENDPRSTTSTNVCS